MICTKAICNLQTIDFATQIASTGAHDIMRQAEALREDKRKAERHEICHCQMCFPGYIGARAGASVTTKRECALCNTELLSPSSYVPMLCIPCATINKLCRMCGGDIDMKNRRGREQPKGRE